MALATTRYRQNYPSAQEGVANTIRLSGNFTTAGAANPSVRSSGPWSVVHSGTGQYTVSLTEPVGEYLAGDAGLWTAAGNANVVKILSTSLALGSSALVPGSFIIETQSVAGTAADLTGPIVSFDIAYRKGTLKNR